MKRTRYLGMLGFVGILASSCAGGTDDLSSTTETLEATAPPSAVSFIPAGKRLTPFGMVDEACVHEIPKGAVLGVSGDVTRNGIVIDHYDKCPSAVTLPAVDAHTPTVNGWVEWSNANATLNAGLAQYNQLISEWTVPWAPGSSDWRGTVIYLFSSFENASKNEIIQPVLQFGYDGHNGGSYWILTSWYVKPGYYTYGTPVRVYTGDTILGEVFQTGSSQWEIVGEDVNSQLETDLVISSTSIFSTVQGGVLEAYNVSSCDDLPTVNSIGFNPVHVWEAGPAWNNFTQVAPSFTNNVTGSLSPSCGYSVSSTSSTTTLSLTY